LTSGKCPSLVASRRVAFHLKGHAFSRWKYHQVDCFIAASHAIHQMLTEDGVDPNRVVTVYEGIDLHRVQAEPAANIHAELWLPTHAPVVGAVAALTQEKGHKYLVDAAALVVREVPDARFVVLGEGDLRPALERQVKELHLDKHVLLPGFRADILSFIKSFDVFVMSSLFEGLGTSLLDAMALSKATVASDTGGIPEVVSHGETGYLVPPRDARELASAIVKLLKDPARRERMGAAGLARVTRVFSADGNGGKDARGL
jgi:glycosyltransferase involved in cell wall biosynthesis